MTETDVMKAERIAMSRIGTAILGWTNKTLEIEWTQEGLGYSTIKGIFINHDPKMIYEMPESEKYIFRRGVFVHELLHQIYTEGCGYKNTYSTYPQHTHNILRHIPNILEDAAIEMFAPYKIGGSLLAALRFTRDFVHMMTDKIEPKMSPLMQFIYALNRFVHWGEIESFYSKEAEEVFKECIPVIQLAIKEPIASKRYLYFSEIVKNAYTLWEPFSQEEEEKLEKMASATQVETSSIAETLTGQVIGAYDEKRKASANAILGNVVTKEMLAKKEDSSVQKNLSNAEIDKLANDIKEEIAKEKMALAKNDASDTSCDDSDLDIKINSLKESTCINTRKIDTYMKTRPYNFYLENYTWEIKNLSKELKKILARQTEEKFATASGKYSIKKGSIGTSSKFFCKRKEASNTLDVAVMLLVDCSGSMSGNGINAARKNAIIFAEALKSLDIPCYIIGFRADFKADAYHEHYVTWKNTSYERSQLAKIYANGNNYDGYSIRYAAELLRKRPETNKIMFVISDGQPSCSRYRVGRSRKYGINDTIAAIKENSNDMTIFGIALGPYVEASLLQTMYKKNFIHCREYENLNIIFSKQLVKLLNNNFRH